MNEDWTRAFGGIPIYGPVMTQPKMISNIDMANAQVASARSAQRAQWAQWSGLNQLLLQNARPRTQWDDDYEAALSELDEIAPGWTE